MLSPTHPDAVRQLERLADRLRVVGPRLAARDGAEAHDLLRALRSGLQDLADLAADADGRPRRRVPALAGFALADQALVLGHDLLGQPPHQHPPADQPERTDVFRATAVQAIDRLNRLISPPSLPRTGASPPSAPRRPLPFRGPAKTPGAGPGPSSAPAGSDRVQFVGRRS